MSLGEQIVIHLFDVLFFTDLREDHTHKAVGDNKVVHTRTGNQLLIVRIHHLGDQLGLGHPSLFFVRLENLPN